MYHPLILALVSLLTATRTTLAQQTPLQCHDPVMTRWMLNSAGETPCQVLQDLMQICNPSYTVDWLTPSYSCDNSPTSITAACCCGSPTFALFSACWSCQYNYTMDIVSTSFTSFEKDCSYIPAPLNEYDPIIRSQAEQINMPLWAEMIPSAGRWDLAAAFRNATPDIPTASPPIPTNYPAATTASTALSAGAIVGIIVGSVFGTSFMFIAAALILWGTLGPGCRRRKKDDDIRVGEHMGYLDGEYIYVRPETIPDIIGPNGHRYTLRRESNHLQPDLGGVSDYSSRGPSEYEDDTFGAVRPLRSQSRADSRTLSYAPIRSPSHIDSPDLYSPARHASQDGRYTGYHPGESPLVRDDPRYRSSRDGYGFEERPRRPISGNYSQHTRPSGDHHRQSRERPRSGHFVSRPVSGQFNARPRSGQFGSRPTSGQFDFYQVPVDFDTPPAARPPSTRRPVSAQFSTRAPSRSGQFEFYEVPAETASPTPAPVGSRPVSGQYSIRPRGSTERKRDHRTSVRSSFRHGSVDSTTRRSGDGGGRFIRLAEGRRASVDGRVSQEKGRFSREEGRFSKEEPRFNKEDGWGRRSREVGRRSRDLYRKASLSEGDEDRERQGGNEGDEEESMDAPRPSGVTESSIGAPPRRSDATASGVGRQVHQQHLRQRSQSARTSCEIDMVIQDYDAESTPVPPTTTSGPPTSNSHPSAAPYKPPRSPLRVVNPQHSDSDRDQHRPNSNLRPQPSLLARARGLLSARSSRSNISAGNRSSNRSSSIDGSGGGGGAPVPPSAWQQRLPNLLLRNRSGSTDLGRGKSEDSAQGSDVTSVYFSAVGHANPTPATTPGSAPGSREGPTPAAPADNASYQQEVDAGVQLIVESSPTTQSPESHESGPPGYLESIPDDIQASGAAPDTHLRVEPNPNRMSTLTQDTTVSADWDSTMSSGVIQTWEAARRPTGFVGMGRVLSPTEPNTQHSQVSLSTAVSNLSDSEDGARLLPENRVE
ncbi:Stress response protein NST1 [Magnaporthe oryzae 70-15] [Rhizoctonia solani]|uniref:Stress response protein NST1 [Magnaporthe oryzae 70-15] n=1 Tax=Rhizoctonia solani TaxID=456999 RepID=A0A0K6GCE9_9AGAM|nr:Stress response protein NST1 [Magnaporthe oryzae 70-15] [Rhizoctonia solani]